MKVKKISCYNQRLLQGNKYTCKKRKTLTGYPHIDKPWMQYYDTKKIKEYKNTMPKCTILDYLKEKNIGKENNTAITNYGKKITYKELYNNIDNASKALLKFGVKENERVLYLMPNIPETAYLFYGTSQIGAVSDYIDPRPDSINLEVSAKKMLSMIKNEKINHIVCLDQCYLAMIKSIENELKELGINKIILVSPNSFMSKKMMLNYLKQKIKYNGIKVTKEELKRMKQVGKKIEESKVNSKIEIIDYKELLKKSNNVIIKKAKYSPNRMETIVHTSGTSSPMPKPIPLTTDNLNCYVHQTFYSNMPMKSKDKALHILPYFAAFGLSNVVHSGLCHNSNLIQVPEFSPKYLSQLIIDNKPQILIGPPTWLINLMNDNKLTHEDLSYLTMITYGGDSMSEKDEDSINEFLRKHNCKCKITKGHGMSEISGCGTFAIGEYNDPNSMGIPLFGTTYAIYDNNLNKMKKIQKNGFAEGEIIISSPSASSGKLDDNSYINHISINNIDFIKTGDIGKMDSTGKISFLTRDNRMFTRFDGAKIKPHIIEKLIEEDSNVRYCIVTPYYEESEFGNMPKASIVLKDNNKSMDEKADIVEKIISEKFINNSEISSRQIPTKFSFIDELPISDKSGKVNYKDIELQQLNGNEITVVMSETNMAVDSIKVIKPEHEKIKIKK